MKAKEYVDKYYNADDRDMACVSIMEALFREVKAIADSRNAQSNMALISIFKEQDKKWAAIMRKVGLPQNELFIMFCTRQLPDLKGRI